jgi:hypothetical protein
VRLGDDINGYVADENLRSIADIAPWLQEAIAHFYPSSEYAARLSSEIKERASRCLFQPPITGASAVCPHCGAPYASNMDELIAFVCPRCGKLSRSTAAEGSGSARPDGALWHAILSSRHQLLRTNCQ